MNGLQALLVGLALVAVTQAAEPVFKGIDPKALVLIVFIILAWHPLFNNGPHIWQVAHNS